MADNQASSEKQEYTHTVSQFLLVILCIIPSVLFFAVYGEPHFFILIFLLMLGGSGLFSTLIISHFIKKLKLYRVPYDVMRFFVVGGLTGGGVSVAIHVCITFVVVLLFRVPVSAFLNSLLATFFFSLIALVIGLLLGWLGLPKYENDE